MSNTKNIMTINQQMQLQLLILLKLLGLILYSSLFNFQICSGNCCRYCIPPHLFILIQVSYYYVSEIWEALRAAAEADLDLAQTIVESAGVIVQGADLSICYDERGTKFNFSLIPPKKVYEFLPKASWFSNITKVV